MTSGLSGRSLRRRGVDRAVRLERQRGSGSLGLGLRLLVLRALLVLGGLVVLRRLVVLCGLVVFRALFVLAALGLVVLCGLLVLRLRLEDAANAGAQRRLAGACRPSVGPAFGLEELRLGVVGDVVAPDLVGTFAQQRAIEELEETLLPVVLGLLGDTFVVLVGVVAFLAEGERIAERSRRQRIVGILAQDDFVGVNGERSLCDDHVAQKRANLGLVVHVSRIGLIVDRFVAIRLFRLCGSSGQGDTDERDGQACVSLLPGDHC